MPKFCYKPLGITQKDVILRRESCLLELEEGVFYVYYASQTKEGQSRKTPRVQGGAAGQAEGHQDLMPVMGRRQLPKISPALDYARYRLTPDDIPRPWSVAALFGRVAPLELEIGSGKGMFLAKAASERPQHLFLGIEIGPKYASFAAATLARAARDSSGLENGGLENARVVCGDAATVLRDVIPDASLDAVHIYFPDPWWKRAHRKRRIVRADVVQLIERRLVTGGRLHFWTDVEEYFTTGKKIVTASTALTIVAESPQGECDYQTHFERRTLLHKQVVYRVTFEKTE